MIIRGKLTARVNVCMYERVSKNTKWENPPIKGVNGGDTNPIAIAFEGVTFGIDNDALSGIVAGGDEDGS